VFTEQQPQYSAASRLFKQRGVIAAPSIPTVPATKPPLRWAKSDPLSLSSPVFRAKQTKLTATSLSIGSIACMQADSQAYQARVSFYRGMFWLQFALLAA
jgi:hypothetical protein